ncbi:MAG: thioesterase family protein, partial [Caulobacteraceae bacterium]|nr:thioesterase family protein [Caulobacter sp.]
MVLSFTQMFGQVEVDGGAHRLAPSPNWLHARTAAGSVSAALCVRAAATLIGEGLRLRSGHFAFARPAAGALRATPALVRRGR